MSSSYYKPNKFKKLAKAGVEELLEHRQKINSGRPDKRGKRHNEKCMRVLINLLLKSSLIGVANKQAKVEEDETKDSEL